MTATVRTINIEAAPIQNWREWKTGAGIGFSKFPANREAAERWVGSLRDPKTAVRCPQRSER
jgi:hypothetical protein